MAPSQSKAFLIRTDSRVAEEESPLCFKKERFTLRFFEYQPEPELSLLVPRGGPGSSGGLCHGLDAAVPITEEEDLPEHLRPPKASLASSV